jgi:hypothetical protein
MAYLKLILQEGNFVRYDGLLRAANKDMNEKNALDSCEES